MKKALSFIIIALISTATYGQEYIDPLEDDKAFMEEGPFVDDESFMDDDHLDSDGMVMAGEKHSVTTNSFWNNWFVSGAATFSVFWSDQESGLPQGIGHSFRNNWGLSLAIGKWFTPGIGLRTKLNGFWGRAVTSGGRHDNSNHYWTLHEQILLNLSNMLYGYNERRLYNCIPYIGVGVGHSTTYDHGGIGFSTGLWNTFKLSRKWSVGVDINYGIYEPDADGISSGNGHDKILNFEIGVTYNIGRPGWKKSPDVEAMRIMHITEIDAMKAQIRDLQMENEYLHDQLEGKGE